MSRITFNLAAKCDKAGRSQNQDNYWVCPDLAKWDAPVDGVVGTDEDVELSDKGALLVVADGMGGMNAGEVASELVIKGIQKKFSQIPDAILGDGAQIQKFIREAIVEADESVKQYAKAHREAEGLGSTIVLLWLLGDKAYCGWCGDSRIYRFNPNNELVRLSHDHSYVQSLVDEGKISEDEAFDHPDGNVITKALGDNGNKADPELKVYDVYQRDVFMLCSDGLCGLLQDAEINKIIADNCTSSKDALAALWEAGEKAHWTDNATIDVLNVVEGGKLAKGRPDGYPVVAKKPAVKKGDEKPQVISDGNGILSKILKPPYLYIIALVSLCLLGLALFHVFGGKKDAGSTNHEFSVEAPQQEVIDDNNNTSGNQNNNGGDSQSQQGQNGNNSGNQGNQSNGGNGGRPGRNNSGNGPGNQNNNGGNSQVQQGQNGNNSGNQGGQSNGNNGGIQGAIDQLHQGSGNNGGNSGNPNGQTTEVHPSQDYTNLVNSVLNDYNNAKKAYSIVKQKGWRSRENDDAVSHFMSTISENLRVLEGDTRNYNALPNSKKQEINAAKGFVTEINNNYRQYPTAPPRNQYNDSYEGDDVYGGSRSL